jgi:integrase
MTQSKPIREKITGLRQRPRGDGWRIWWEPHATAARLGFKPVELSETRLTWSKREAERLNREVKQAMQTGDKPTPKSGDRTMASLINTYMQSPQFKKLRPKTKQSYQSNLSIIDRKWGTENVTDFSKPIVATWYDANLEARGQWQAVSLNRTMSILFEFAERKGWRPENSNPAFKIRAKAPKGRARRLSWEESDALIAAAHKLEMPSMALAIGLSLYQGQRQTDVRKATPADFVWVTEANNQSLRRKLVWVLERSKRLTQGAMPIHTEILPEITQKLLDVPDDADTLLTDDSTGRPWSKDLFVKRFAAIRTEACKSCPSLHDVQFRDLRRTFGARARAGGATKDDTGDVLGNSAANNLELSEIYMAPQFETASRAVEAVQRPTPERAVK